MQTKTAFNPFKHTTIFFMFGILCALLLALYALNWKIAAGPYARPEIQSADFADFFQVEIHTEEIKSIAPTPKPQVQTSSTERAEINSQVIEVANTKMTLDKFNIQATDIKPVQNPVILNNTEENPNKEFYEVVEIAPEFPGGFSALYVWLANAIVYPAFAREAGIEGTVYVRFIINEDGTISDATIIRGIGGGCNEEVLRVIGLMPTWKAGIQGNSKVKVRYTLPIHFKLD